MFLIFGGYLRTSSPRTRSCIGIFTSTPQVVLIAIMSQPTEAQVTRLEHSDKRQFRLYNIIIVIAMSFGSMSYGYSASKDTFPWLGLRGF